MGKRRLLAVREKEGESDHKTWKQKIELLKEMMGNVKEDTNDQVTAKARIKMAETRWMPHQGVNKLEDLDLSDPQISLEWKLCDPAILKDLLNPGGRDRLFKTLSEEEKDIYLNKTDSKGARYTDLETEKAGFTRKNVAKAIIHIRK